MINTLLELASKRPRIHKARVCAAVVIRKGLIVSVGFNSLKTHPKAASWHRQARRPYECIHLHAEMDALLRADQEGFKNFDTSTLYVARATWDQEKKTSFMGLALPCSSCVCAIQEYNIPRVVFTTDNQTLGELNL